jgi:ribosomal protein S18 acetylase RimI-like enzyme
MERQLTGALPLPMWPDGIALSRLEPVAVHALMRVAYSQGYGSVPATAEEWWDVVSNDSEFDPELAIVVSEPSGVPAGFILCWTSSFIKDLVVRPDLRWRGIGASLLAEAFRRLAARGHQSVALKVKEENAVARALYERIGFKASFSF